MDAEQAIENARKLEQIRVAQAQMLQSLQRQNQAQKNSIQGKLPDNLQY